MARHPDLPTRVQRGVYFLPFDAVSKEGERAIVVAVDSNRQRVYEAQFDPHDWTAKARAEREAAAFLDQHDPLWRIAA